MPHLHRAHRYHTMAKPDSVYITCKCGETEAVGTYYSPTKAPHPGWDPEHWRLHGHRKAKACADRWLKHVRRLHAGWDRALARRATKVGRTFEEQDKWEREEVFQGLPANEIEDEGVPSSSTP